MGSRGDESPHIYHVDCGTEERGLVEMEQVIQSANFRDLTPINLEALPHEGMSGQSRPTGLPLGMVNQTF